jgi:DNA adenine methylase
MSKTLLRYPGGKAKAIKVLEQYIPENTTKIVSPFFGGGSLEFHLASKGIEVQGFDVFKPVVNFWRAVKHDKQKLVEEIRKLVPVDKEKFRYLQTLLKHRNDSLFILDYEAAAIFFVLNRCSFSGTTLAGGYSIQAAEGRLTESSIQRVLDFNSYNVHVDSKSFEEVIASTDSLLFCDPPYYLGKKSNLYGNNGEDHRNFDHELLHRQLSNKNNWILCYNNDPYIQELYKGYKIVEPSWNYGMSSDKSSKEILILNT